MANNRRQELYDRIRESSKDEVILEEMIRLGFWPRSTGVPSPAEESIRRQGELRRQLREIGAETARLGNIERLKKEQRKKRMLESRKRRHETKEKRLAERARKTAEWKAKNRRELTYLGPEVSAGLPLREGNSERLREFGLPVLQDPAELATAMGMTLGELRFLAYSRPASQISHYHQFELAKKSGGTRLISAPLPRLKAAQYWVLDHLLSKLEVTEVAHGFVPGRSIVTGAAPHVGAAVVVNLDLKDFFPSVSYRRVRGLFRWFGYSEATATVLTLLLTEPVRRKVELDERRFHVALSERVLPQGAPTSPVITNLICRRLDKRLLGAASKLGFVYTRYADDLSFSAKDRAQVGRLLRQVRKIVADEGFEVHPAKTRVFGRGRRQEVTGLTVNDGLGVSRKKLRQFRAVLFQVEKDGPEGKHFGPAGDGDVVASLHGFANFVYGVDPEKGGPLRERTLALVKKHGTKPPPKPGPNTRRKPSAPANDGPVAGSNTTDATAGKKKKKWWKIF